MFTFCKATAAALLAATLAAGPGLANEPVPVAPDTAAASAAPEGKGSEGTDKPALQSVNPTDRNAAEYCANIADAATDARFQRQVEALKALEKKIQERVVTLEQKRAEYEDWLQRREKFLKSAEDNLVAIYTQMRPDAASQQLAIMNEFTAAAILAKLPARTASAILNEMDPTKAAQLTNIMAGLSDRASSQRNAG